MRTSSDLYQEQFNELPKWPAVITEKVEVGIRNMAEVQVESRHKQVQLLLCWSQTVCQMISEQLLVFVTEMKTLARL